MGIVVYYYTYYSLVGSTESYCRQGGRAAARGHFPKAFFRPNPTIPKFKRPWSLVPPASQRRHRQSSPPVASSSSLPTAATGRGEPPRSPRPRGLGPIRSFVALSKSFVTLAANCPSTFDRARGCLLDVASLSEALSEAPPARSGAPRGSLRGSLELPEALHCSTDQRDSWRHVEPSGPQMLRSLSLGLLFSFQRET